MVVCAPCHLKMDMDSASGCVIDIRKLAVAVA